MNPPCILVVEDNPITRKVFRVALAGEGYTVLEAPDGRTALELMARHAPQMVLQDLILPDMDGLELARQLRACAAGAAIPIVAVSGFLSQMEQTHSLQAGFTDYLFKPVEPSHLLSTVHAYLRPVELRGQAGRGKVVLVADDDPVQGKLLRIRLEQEGFRIVPAADGAEALDLARAAPPDAIISDVLMPRLDGFRLCLAVRQDARLRDIPVVLTSAAYTEDLDYRLARKAGASDLVLRTPGHQAVIESLLACLARAPHPPPPHPVELPLDEYTHRVVRQLEHQAGLGVTLGRRLALLEAELGILAHVVETLQDTSATEAVLGELLNRSLNAAGISRGAAYLVEPDGRLSLRARLGYAAEAEGPLRDFFGRTDLLRRVLEKGEPLGVNLVEPREDGAEDLLAQNGARSILLTPLMLADKRLGVLGMASASRELGQDWFAFAKSMGSQIAQALELARTLARLSASEQRYRDLVESLDAVVWEADPQTERFTFVSRRAEGLLGYPLAEWLQRPDFWACLVHPDDREQARARRREAAAGGADTLSYRVVAADGRVLRVQDTVSVAGDEAGHVGRLRGVMVDITDRIRLKEQQTKLAVAREIQQGFFPAAPPGLAGFDIAGSSLPAEATGGDYFDYVPLPDGSLAVAVGDASGHGFGPALLMAETRAYLRALALTQTDLSEILTLLNRALVEESQRAQFVTLLLARLDPRTRVLSYASAGHTAGQVLDVAGNVKATLESTAPPLGILPHQDFPAGQAVPLEAGDVVLLLTDGVVEAFSPEGALFGSRRALDFVRANLHDSAADLVAGLHRAVQTFGQGTPQHDDVTAVVIKTQPQP
jgi:PAS domain S-box-containing protein